MHTAPLRNSYLLIAKVTKGNSSYAKGDNNHLLNILSYK